MLVIPDDPTHEGKNEIPGMDFQANKDDSPCLYLNYSTKTSTVFL